MLKEWEAEYQTGSSYTEKALEFCRMPLKSFARQLCTYMYEETAQEKKHQKA